MDEELQGTDTLIPTSLLGKIKRLGITSVEEEICLILATIGCGGISTLNNSAASATQQQENNKTECTFPEMMYGMCKFHASGREDMNVRMLLPSNECKDSVGNIGGRPFVCQVIDAFRLPTDEDLRMVVETINNTQQDSHSEAVDANRQFGQNPNGVGVSSLQICSSKIFSSLQSETEDKVKYYGCLCWSEKEIPSQEYLENALLHGSIINGSIQSTHPLPNIYPLQILQSTPLRVLHRRSGAVRKRFILSLHVSRISDHYFNLHLSTSGGTYVKEFVHGDCGRTVPNVGTLLGCKTDIMELDCEGVGSTACDFDENEPEVIEDNVGNINI
jgi:tRNA pseudouridine synthase 10